MLAAGLAGVLGVAVVLCCALREASAVGPNSDGASFALQGWAMAHGNPLLHGWRLADVSFYATEVPEYALAGLVVGLRPAIAPACAAVTFTILVVLAAVVARGRSRGLAGAVAALMAVAIMAGPSSQAASVVLTEPDHTGLILIAVHLALAALVVTACWVALRRMTWSGDLVAVLLAAGIAANLAAYALLYVTGPATAQDIAPAFAMGAALAGRVLGAPLAGYWQRRMAPGKLGGWPLAAGWAAVVLAVSIPPLVAARPAPPPNAELARWLAGHGLRSGIAHYWQSSSVTLDSGGAVTMRDVWDYGPAGGIRPYPWEEDTGLLDPGRNYANFVIAARHSGLTRPAIERRFGPPARSYQVGTFTVLVYDRNLLPELSGLPAPWPGRISW